MLARVMKSKFAKPAMMVSTALSLIIAPAILYADASAPGIDRPKMMKKKPHARVKAKARMAKPMMKKEPMAEPMAEKPAMVEPAPEPAPAAPEPVAVAAPEPAPVPAPEPAPQPVAAAPRGGGSTIWLALGAAAAIAAGVIIASDGGSKSP